MSQPAIWAAVAGRPRFGVSTTVARAHPAATTAITAHARSRVDMLHLAVGGHAPGLDRVAVEDGVVAVVGDEPVAFGLHGPRVVGGARLQHARAAVHVRPPSLVTSTLVIVPPPDQAIPEIW